MSILDTVIENSLESLNIEHFYNDYLVADKRTPVHDMSLGEIANVHYSENQYGLYKRFLTEHDLQNKLTRYGGAEGTLETVLITAKHAGALTGLSELDERHITFFDGAQDAISNVISCTVSPLGSGYRNKQFVLAAIPSYPYAASILNQKCGVKLFQAFSGDEFAQGVVDCIDETIGAILVNIPQNPLGYILTADHAERINHAARLHDCAIIVDMVYAGFTDKGDIQQALSQFDPERTIYCDSFSKIFGLPGLRLGMAFSSNQQICSALRAVKSAHSLLPSALKYLFIGYLLKNHQELIEAIQSSLRMRHHLFASSFESLNSSAARLFPSDNHLYRCIDLGGMSITSDKALDEWTYSLEKMTGVRVTSGSKFFPNLNFVQNHSPKYMYCSSGQTHKPFWRISLGKESEIEAVSQKICNFLRNH
ncbi:pyridoxal phosphate-dependent aminotransferase [Paenibacillus sonchi]|uniref:pyridoxal phosphate-dependent aminotransferase n=1 Tax=Paenibacillus sonchi TaxID=373687 RepID=UPI0002E30938|nr:pyridoxal phosphate-dependent aminotransferase [Paenibacillus sonchi]